VKSYAAMGIGSQILAWDHVHVGVKIIWCTAIKC